ncbi:MAG: hypothetical protein FWC41_07015 [Firmicutes bacterium]|nr:hypothetical protein [Bacillota bacterium]
MKYILRGSFVCDNCRKNCESTCSQELNEIYHGIRIDDELYPRKQLIGCLGEYCDEPCFLRKEKSDLTIEQCINLIKYMGNKLMENIL